MITRRSLAGHSPDHLGKDFFDFLAEYADALDPLRCSSSAVAAEAHRPHLPQLGEPGVQVAHVLLESSVGRYLPCVRARRELERLARNLQSAVPAPGRSASADDHMAGRGNPHADGGSTLANGDRLPGGGVYVDVAIGTLPQGVIGIRGMILMGEDRVPCEGAAPLHAYRIAETHLFCRGRCWGPGSPPGGTLAGVGRRKTSADTHIAAGIGHRAAGAHGLESPESRVDLGNHTRYFVKLRFQGMEFDLNPLSPPACTMSSLSIQS